MTEHVKEKRKVGFAKNSSMCVIYVSDACVSNYPLFRKNLIF